ncbi:MAG: energy transducer TonB [Pseudomonadota bacterium]
MSNKMASSILALLFILGLSVSFNSHASFEQAMAIYSKGQFEEAREAFKTMAAIGDSSSLFNLGVMYFRGEAVEKDSVKAYVLMKIANEGAQDEGLAKTEKAVFSRLSDEQKSASEKLYKELNAIYGVENIIGNIVPKLLNDEDCEPEAKALTRTIPIYPKSELQMGRMGVVYAEHTISPEGYPREIIVISSSSRAFTKSARKAVLGRFYEPPASGKPKEHRLNLIYQIDLKKGATVRTAPFVKEMEELEQKAQDGDVVSQFLYARKLNTYRQFGEYLPEKDFQYREANTWYTKSAQAGLTHSQFEIGRNMMEGRGCEVDRENGFKWIKAAAVGGHSRAQKYLASTELAGRAVAGDETQSVVNWLRNAAQDQAYGYPAKLMLAWELVSSAEKNLWNPDEALALIKDPPNTFEDDIRILETQAAAWALKDNYKKAVKLQLKAAKLAEKQGWKIPKIDERLKLYEDSKFYLGSYY